MWGQEWESCNLRAHGTAIWGVFSPEPVSNKIPLYVHSPGTQLIVHRGPRSSVSPFRARPENLCRADRNTATFHQPRAEPGKGE